MGFFDRYIFQHRQIAALSGQIATLNAQLNEANAQRDWFKAMAHDAGTKLLKKEAELKTEIKRNRLREDDLINQIISLGGGRPVLPRLETPKPEPEPTKGLTSIQEGLLRDRAREYCEQKAQGDPVTAEELEQIYQQMLADPDTWLTD